MSSEFLQSQLMVQKYVGIVIATISLLTIGIPCSGFANSLKSHSPNIFEHSYTIELLARDSTDLRSSLSQNSQNSASARSEKKETRNISEVTEQPNNQVSTSNPINLVGRVDVPLYGGSMDSTIVRIAFNGGTRETYSDADGNYSFFNVPSGSISLTAKLPMEPMDQVTTYDMLRVGQHILGIDEFKEPLILLAADVNRSGNISAFDLTAIRRVILGLDAAFGGLHEALTLGADHLFSDEREPWLDSTNWGTQFSFVSTDINSLDISTIKLGDVNPISFLRPRGASELVIDDRFVEYGQQVEVLVRNDYESGIAGLQLAIIANGSLLVEAADQNIELFSNKVNGALRVSMVQDVLPGEPLMSWTFTPSTSGMLSDLIQISADIPNESYSSENHQPTQLALRWNAKRFNDSQAEINAFPNPFDNHLSVSAHLPSVGNHKLEVADITGRSFAERRLDINQDAWHNLRLNTEDWPSGIYILTLEGPSGRHTQRVVLDQ